MIHTPFDVDGTDGAIELLVPRDPADPWFVVAANADGIAWRVTPDACELELSAAMLIALVQAADERLLATYQPPPVPSMDADPVPHVVLGGES